MSPSGRYGKSAWMAGAAPALDRIEASSRMLEPRRLLRRASAGRCQRAHER